jgi:hypothetical protein
MPVFIKPPKWLPPPRKQRSPAAAAIVGFLFGGIGLGLYFRSVVDFVIPVLFSLASVAVSLAVGDATISGKPGFLVGALIAARWGYCRAHHKNARPVGHP